MIAQAKNETGETTDWQKTTFRIAWLLQQSDQTQEYKRKYNKTHAFTNKTIHNLVDALLNGGVVVVDI